MTCLHNHDQILEFLRKIFLKGFQIYQNYLCALRKFITITVLHLTVMEAFVMTKKTPMGITTSLQPFISNSRKTEELYDRVKTSIFMFREFGQINVEHRK